MLKLPCLQDNIVSETLQISLESSDANPAFPARSPGGDEILSAAMASFNKILTKVRYLRATPKRPNLQLQSDELLQSILQKIEEVTRSHDLERIGSLHLDMQWNALDTASQHLANFTKALRKFDDGTEEKNFVVKELDILEKKIVERREKLPPDSRPYYYDCGTSLYSIL